MENDITTGETLTVLAAAAALGGLGFWLYRRSQKPAPLTMLNPDQLAQLNQLPEKEEITLAQLTEEEIITLAQRTEEEEEIHLAKRLSEREKRRLTGGVTIL